MNKLQALNTWMTPKMPLLILGALALGLLFPDQIGLLCPAVSALMMFQTFANSLGSSVQDLGRVLSHPKPVLITMLSLHLLMPLAALGIGSMCFPDQPLYTLSLVLMEGSPAAVSSLMWIVIGGGSVYRQMLPFCDHAYVTKVHTTVPCDTFFPNLDEDPQWAFKETLQSGEENGVGYEMCLYVRKQ